MRRVWIFAIIMVLVFSVSFVSAQKQERLSIATGGTGGVYYPLGGGMANVLSKYLPYVEATAEVTTASVDNCLLVGAGKADLALIMADVGWDAFQGKEKFREKLPLRTPKFDSHRHFIVLK